MFIQHAFHCCFLLLVPEPQFVFGEGGVLLHFTKNWLSRLVCHCEVQMKSCQKFWFQTANLDRPSSSPTFLASRVSPDRTQHRQRHLRCESFADDSETKDDLNIGWPEGHTVFEPSNHLSYRERCICILWLMLANVMVKALSWHNHLSVWSSYDEKVVNLKLWWPVFLSDPEGVECRAYAVWADFFEWRLHRCSRLLPLARDFELLVRGSKWHKAWKLGNVFFFSSSSSSLQGLGPVCMKVMQGGASKVGSKALKGAAESKKSQWDGRGAWDPKHWDQRVLRVRLVRQTSQSKLKICVTVKPSRCLLHADKSHTMYGCLLDLSCEISPKLSRLLDGQFQWWIAFAATCSGTSWMQVTWSVNFLSLEMCCPWGGTEKSIWLDLVDFIWKTVLSEYQSSRNENS